jgi:hypothetical protein
VVQARARDPIYPSVLPAVLVCVSLAAIREDVSGARQANEAGRIRVWNEMESSSHGLCLQLKWLTGPVLGIVGG